MSRPCRRFNSADPLARCRDHAARLFCGVRYASHAEANLIAFAAREGIATKGCTVYTTHHPCAACTRTLIQAGITSVFYATETFGNGSEITREVEAAKTMFAEAGVRVEQVKDLAKFTHITITGDVFSSDVLKSLSKFKGGGPLTRLEPGSK